MSQSKIRTLLESRLKAWADSRTPALKVAWENVEFDAPAGIYLKSNLMPADTDSQDIEGNHRLYTGVYQISIVAPKNQGLGPAESLAEEIQAQFPNALRLEDGGFVLMLVTPMSIGPYIPNQDSITVPVFCTYRADTI